MIRRLLKIADGYFSAGVNHILARTFNLLEARVVAWDGELWLLAFPPSDKWSCDQCGTQDGVLFPVGHGRGTRTVGPWEDGYDVPLSELQDVKSLLVLDMLSTIRKVKRDK